MKFLSLLTIFSLLFFISCNGDDDVQPIEEPADEVITTVRITFGEGFSSRGFLFRDLDGDGGNLPVITADTLPAQTTLDYTVQFLNESMTPLEDVTQEIQAEGVAHQVFMEADGLNFSYQYEDEDANGDAIGLVGKAITFVDGEGTLKLTLRHNPTKDGVGVAGGQITNANGETDIEVVFPLVIR